MAVRCSQMQLWSLVSKHTCIIRTTVFLSWFHFAKGQKQGWAQGKQDTSFFTVSVICCCRGQGGQFKCFFTSKCSKNDQLFAFWLGVCRAIWPPKLVLASVVFVACHSCIIHTLQRLSEGAAEIKACKWNKGCLPGLEGTWNLGTVCGTNAWPLSCNHAEAGRCVQDKRGR